MISKGGYRLFCFSMKLFLLYVNDLSNCLDQAEPSTFADDTNVSTSEESVKKLETQLNLELDNIYRWLVANRLTLNYSKTEYMVIGSRHNLGKKNRGKMELIP